MEKLLIFIVQVSIGYSLNSDLSQAPKNRSTEMFKEHIYKESNNKCNEEAPFSYEYLHNIKLSNPNHILNCHITFANLNFMKCFQNVIILLQPPAIKTVSKRKCIDLVILLEALLVE